MHMFTYITIQMYAAIIYINIFYALNISHLANSALCCLCVYDVMTDQFVLDNHL